MMIFHLSDIHGDISFLAALAHELKHAHVVALSGDITHNGDVAAARSIMEAIAALNSTIVAVHGNWDGPAVQEYLRESGYGVHGRGRIVEGIGFFGAGGCPASMFDFPSEYTEEELAALLGKGYGEIRGAAAAVLISHTPPKNCLDRTFLGIRAGSASVREFIEKSTVDLCLTGHIHESPGREVLNSCTVVNAGPFMKGRYALAALDPATGLGEVRLQKAGKGKRRP